LRERTADAVLRLLGSRSRAEIAEETADTADTAELPTFETEERNMVSGVLSLSQRSIRSIMTPRADITWINVDTDAAAIRRQILETPHSFFPVCRGQLDDIVGVARAKDLMGELAENGKIDLARTVREPIVMPEAVGVLRVMETLKRSKGQLVLIADEYGTIQGLVTPIDLLEAIAGEFPDEDEQPVVQELGRGQWRVDGTADLHYLQQVLHTDALVAEDDEYTSLAGFMLERFGTLPGTGQAIELDGLRFEVVEVMERRIATVLISRVEFAADGAPHEPHL
jgi:CBS domain containing-hemolysin-like protein